MRRLRRFFAAPAAPAASVAPPAATGALVAVRWQ